MHVWAHTHTVTCMWRTDSPSTMWAPERTQAVKLNGSADSPWAISLTLILTLWKRNLFHWSPLSCFIVLSIDFLLLFWGFFTISFLLGWMLTFTSLFMLPDCIWANTEVATCRVYGRSSRETSQDFVCPAHWSWQPMIAQSPLTHPVDCAHVGSHWGLQALPPQTCHVCEHISVDFDV